MIGRPVIRRGFGNGGAAVPKLPKPTHVLGVSYCSGCWQSRPDDFSLYLVDSRCAFDSHWHCLSAPLATLAGGNANHTVRSLAQGPSRAIGGSSTLLLTVLPAFAPNRFDRQSRRAGAGFCSWGTSRPQCPVRYRRPRHGCSDGRCVWCPVPAPRPPA